MTVLEPRPPVAWNGDWEWTSGLEIDTLAGVFACGARPPIECIELLAERGLSDMIDDVFELVLISGLDP